jgi:hypothetical protein
MKRIIATILLGILVLGVGACANQPTPRAAARGSGEFVYVAFINPEMADRVDEVLKNSGIKHSVVGGSEVYGVAVPLSDEVQAKSLLRADARKQKYWIRLK